MNIMNFKMCTLALLMAGFAAGSHAVDGVLEINQICAEQTGCFTGDTAGFPVTIGNTAPGKSVRLTGDLVVSGASAIQVQSSNVTIDLNGFSISGNVSSGNGVFVSAGQMATLQGISVYNGTIRQMGGLGVDLPAFSRVENLQIINNGQDGVSVREGSRVNHNMVINNGGDGIHATEGTMISNNTVYNNSDDGIDDSTDDNLNSEIGGGMVSGNLVRTNGGSSSDFNLNLDATTGYQNNVISTDPDDSDGSLVKGGISLGNNACDGVVC